MSRPLDRSRPLWETYLVEGLEGGRFAILTKTHHAMVDGVTAVDIGQVILDATPEPRESPTDTWRPAAEPSSIELVAGAVGDLIRRPSGAVDLVRTTVTDVRRTAGRLGRGGRWRAGDGSDHGAYGSGQPAQRRRSASATLCDRRHSTG